MDKHQLIESAVETARQAQIRDDVCARSVLIGLQSICDMIPDELVTASLSLAGGTGAASGSCGAYCSGLLGVGTVFNAPVDDELSNPALKMQGVDKFVEYRDAFLKKMGTVLCPEIHKKIFGRSYILTDPEQEMEFLTLEGHHIKCAEVVAAATKIAAEMILNAE